YVSLRLVLFLMFFSFMYGGHQMLQPAYGRHSQMVIGDSIQGGETSSSGNISTEPPRVSWRVFYL
ncbi:hypothetical protein, partial [Escherichia coli]|uniref:hypothetical protein n=1 Tax=Escherichia coli TaxID=562 RepID=UPI000B6D91BF